jgi:cytosine/uracil/thiamine/allantoin permease
VLATETHAPRQAKECDRSLAPADPAELPLDLLKPFPAEMMTRWKVSKAVGNVKNDDSESNHAHIGGRRRGSLPRYLKFEVAIANATYSICHLRLACEDFSRCVLSQRLQTLEQLLGIEAVYSVLSSIVTYTSTIGNDNYVYLRDNFP